MRLVLLSAALLLAFVASAPAEVLYSISQPAFEMIPSINLSFKVPSLLTTSTTIPGSSIDSPEISWGILTLPIQSVSINPGLDGTTPFIRVTTSDFFSYTCFESNLYCSGTPINAQVFDHFGTYTQAMMQLTISNDNGVATATPEPRFVTASGIVALLTIVEISRRSRSSCRDQACVVSNFS